MSFAPTYSMYPEYARDAITRWVVGHREEDFSLDLDHAAQVIGDWSGRRAAAVAEQPDRHRAAADSGERCAAAAEVGASW